MGIKVGFVSLGCSKNQVDTEIMLKKLYDEGFEIVNEDIEAEVMIVNTCAFIESAKQESIDTILDLHWLCENRSLRGIVVCGCLAERYHEEIKKELPEANSIVGVGSLDEICNAVRAAYNKKRFCSVKDKESAALGGERILISPEYSAYLKISEGCDNRCTYCAIPLIRGRFRSRPIEELVKEAKELEALGVKELNIIAQDSSAYGIDLYGKYSLAELLRRISAETDIPWIRILYCYPDKITDELIEVIKNDKKIVKYIDIPIQHISDRVLKAMNRHGDSQMIRDTVKRLRDAIPEITLRTTLIVGFPGESEEDFSELCKFVSEARFERLGAFKYSAEENTKAAELEDQLDEQTKESRFDNIMSLQAEIAAEIGEEQIGKRKRVLIEGFDRVANAYFGRSASDAPDVDTKIYILKEKCKKAPADGSFHTVKIVDSIDYDLVGELAD